MIVAFSTLPFLQSIVPASPPGFTTFLGRLSEMEMVSLAVIVLVFSLGCHALLQVCFTLMALQRDRILARYHPEVLAERLALAEAASVKAALPGISLATRWAWVTERLTDAVPVASEAVIVMDHDYDGVRELDNNLPPWWKGLFYASIAFAPLYIYAVHFSSWSQSGLDEYDTEMTLAEAQVIAYLKTQGNVLDESNVPLLADNDALGSGLMMFIAKCAPCHGKAGEGGIGPNLTDPYWIHGGSITEVYTTIKNGVPEKGMIPWKNELRARDMQEIASYILSLQGTDPANGKEPQGERYEETESSK